MRQQATDKPVRAVGTGVERAFLVVAILTALVIVQAVALDAAITEYGICVQLLDKDTTFVPVDQ